jgi:hypothetical protein
VLQYLCGLLVSRWFSFKTPFTYLVDSSASLVDRLLPLLHLQHWTWISVARADNVVDHGKDQYTSKDRRRSSHTCSRYWRCERPEAEEPKRQAELDRDNVHAMPKRPRDHLRGGKGSPLSSFSRTQPIVTMYDVRIETLPQDLMAFKAVVDPRSMQARRELISNETHRAWSGIFQPGVTCIT